MEILYFRGDYRTGKRLNMRKVIPYIASQFRKDKIWLRRTKPSKRQYQIMLAIDDSRSMTSNHSAQVLIENVCLTVLLNALVIQRESFIFSIMRNSVMVLKHLFFVGGFQGLSEQITCL